MNKTCYKQYDTRWGDLGYPKKPYYIKNCGCGEVSICNVMIESSKYASQTPKTIRPYMVQFAEPSGKGTYHSGIPAALKHYGFTSVMEHATMAKLWTEMKKGNRVAVLLMGSKYGGSKKVKWSGSGHFVSAVDYKEEKGKHYLYVKDSASTSNLRNGWISYEECIRGDCLKVWTGVVPAAKKEDPVKTSKPTTPYTGKLPSGTVKYGSKGDDVKAVQNFLNWYYGVKVLNVDGSAGDQTVLWIRKFQSDNGLAVDGSFGPASKAKAQSIINQFKTKQQEVCDYARKLVKNGFKYVYYKDDHGYPTNGGNCIRFVACCLNGGGISVSTKQDGILNDQFAEKLINTTPSKALDLWKARNGANWSIVTTSKTAMPASSLKAGDVLICYNGKDYKHTALYMGNGQIADCNPSKGAKIRAYSELNYPCKIAFRYTK